MESLRTFFGRATGYLRTSRPPGIGSLVKPGHWIGVLLAIALFSATPARAGYVHNFNNENLNAPSYIHPLMTASWSSTGGSIYFRGYGADPGIAILGRNHVYVLTLSLPPGYELALSDIVLKYLSGDNATFQIKVNDENYGASFTSNASLTGITRTKDLVLRNTFTIKITVQNGTDNNWNFTHIDDLEIVGPVRSFDIKTLVDPDANGIVYVKQGASPDGTGSSWDTALQEPGLALLVAAQKPSITQIWVAQGIYQPLQSEGTFKMLNNVKLFGGFSGGESSIQDRNFLEHKTVLAGRSSTVLYNVSVNNSAVLDGFHISDGSGFLADGRYLGGGMYNLNSSPTIVNCVFVNNKAGSTTAEVARGGAMYNDNSNPAIIQCLFFNNQAVGSDEGTGGAIFNRNASPVLTNCTITQNTVSGNSADGNGAGIYSRGASNVVIRNSIIWNNADPYITAGISSISNHTNLTGTITVAYSLIQGGFAGGDHILDADPKFEAIYNENFKQAKTSPVINAGDPATDFSLFPGEGGDKADLANGPRQLNNVIDLGAFEIPSKATWHVNASSTAVNPTGLSWESAFPTLTQAVNSAGNEDEIWVAKGEYQPDPGESFHLVMGVNFYGGFEGDELSLDQRPFPVARGIVPNATVLRGNGSSVIETINNEPGYAVIFDGFTVTGGTAHEGGGMYNYNVLTSINNCTFINNKAEYNGGGLFNVDGALYLTNTLIADNEATNGDGGGVWAGDLSDGYILNCLITENVASGKGGGVYNLDGMMQLTNTTFSGNTAESAGAMATVGFGEAFIFNTIIFGNSSGITDGANESTRYLSLIQGFGPNASTGNLDGWTDPQFVDPASGDYSLRSCSPVINRGGDSPSYTESKDFLGNPRVFNTSIDMGAFEYQGIPMALALPAFDKTVRLPVYLGITGISESCETIALIEPTGEPNEFGGMPITGEITAKAYLASGQTITEGQKVFVKRHFDLTPDNEGPANVTLFFTKQEFDDYNTAYGNAHNASLPANLKIVQYHGSSASGLPGSYPGSMEIITDLTVSLSDDGTIYSVTFPVTSFSGFFASGQSENTLPVTLVSFEARKNEDRASLNWQTSTESNSSHFEIEHSLNGRNWEMIGRIAAKKESATNTSYAYLHKNPENGMNFYRLKMIDLDGTFAYSQIRNLQFNQELTAAVYPNPASSSLRIRWKSTDADEVVGIRLLNLAGKPVFAYRQEIPEEIDISQIAPGNYILTLTLKNGDTKSTKVLIVR